MSGIRIQWNKVLTVVLVDQVGRGSINLECISLMDRISATGVLAAGDGIRIVCWDGLVLVISSLATACVVLQSRCGRYGRRAIVCDDHAGGMGEERRSLERMNRLRFRRRVVLGRWSGVL